MAYTWEIHDISRNQKTHAYTVVFVEVDTVSGERWDYVITLPAGSTKAQYLQELKQAVLAARTIRSQLANLRASIDPLQLEAFINS